MKHKPSLVLYNEDYAQGKGLKMLKEFLCDELKLTHHEMKDLVVKYPPFLSKTKEELIGTFDSMENHGINREEGMKLI